MLDGGGSYHLKIGFCQNRCRPRRDIFRARLNFSMLSFAYKTMIYALVAFMQTSVFSYKQSNINQKLSYLEFSIRIK